MQKFDNNILMAYADGELDRESVAEVERRLDVDVDARAWVGMYRETAGLVRSAVTSYAHEHVPAHLLNSIYAADARLAHGAPQSGSPFSVRLPWMLGVSAVAASLILITLSALGGFFAADYRIGQQETQATARMVAVASARSSAVQTALNTLPSGEAMVWKSSFGGGEGKIVPVRTFKNKEGQYCREYRDEGYGVDGGGLRFAVACRQADKHWRNAYYLVPVSTTN